MRLCRVGNDERSAAPASSAACAHAQQVRAGHVTKGYHRLEQQDAPTSDSDGASRSDSAGGAASDQLDLDSDIGRSAAQLYHDTAL